MKKHNLLILLLLMSVTVVAQKKPKIKGNKVVTNVYQSLEGFSSIEIGDDLSVDITQSETIGYHLKTDKNLIDIIKFENVAGTLKIYTTKKITSSKKLEINLNFRNIHSIVLKDNAQLTSMNKLNFSKLSFSALDNSTYDLDIKVVDATFVFDSSSSGELIVQGEYATMILNENAHLKGDIELEKLELSVNKRAYLNLKGEATILKLTATGSSNIKAKELITTFAELSASNSSDIYVNASKALKLYAEGSSYVYVYGSPEITVDGLNDKSQLIKK